MQNNFSVYIFMIGAQFLFSFFISLSHTICTAQDDDWYGKLARTTTIKKIRIEKWWTNAEPWRFKMINFKRINNKSRRKKYSSRKIKSFILNCWIQAKSPLIKLSKDSEVILLLVAKFWWLLKKLSTAFQQTHAHTKPFFFLSFYYCSLTLHTEWTTSFYFLS